MRVLIVYPKMELYGGGELLVVRLANYLTRQRVPNALLTTNILPEIERDLAGTRIIKYPFQPVKGALKPLNLLRNIFLLQKGVAQTLDQFDVINVHNYPAELAVFPRSKPVVWMCNEPPEVHVRFDAERRHTPRWLAVKGLLGFEKLVVRKSVGEVVVADPFNADRFRRMYGMAPHIISYGIDFQYFAGLPGSTGTPRRSHHFTVLHVGMLTPLKNQMESLRTVACLKDEIPEIRLILAGFGQGQYLQSLQAFIKEKRLEGNVRFEGHVDRKRLRELYHHSDVLLHPIRAQGGWLSPFEAISAKLPVVVSGEMSAAALIQENSLGTVTDDYAGALLDIYRDRAKHDETAVRRAEWVRNNLSWDRFGEKMLAVFRHAAQPAGL